MNFKQVNKLAWKIRKAAAKQQGVPVMEISWKHCITLANIRRKDVVDYIVKIETKHKSLKEMIQHSIAFNHSPTIRTNDNPNNIIIFHHFNKAAETQGLKKRAIEY